MRAIAIGVCGLLAAAAQAPTLAPSRLAGLAAEYCVAGGETLGDVAARFGEDVATIARRNGLEPKARLRQGSMLRLDAVHIVPESARSIVVNISQRMLFVRAPDGVRAFPVAVGRRTWPTPTGAFTIENKEENPTWDVPASIQEEMRRSGKTPLLSVPPSPDNPLGAYWIGLSLPGIGIHGTNAPRSIYRADTHGCVRVHPQRIAELFDLVVEGEAGEIVDEPLLVALQAGVVYVEAHADIYGGRNHDVAALRAIADRAGLTGLVDWTIAAEAVRLREGIAVNVSVR